MEAKANGRQGDEWEVAPAVVDPGGHVLGLLGMRDADVPEGADLAMTLPVTPRVTNNRGGLQGGLLATLVDVVAGRAAGLRLAEGDSAATADMNMHFLSAVTVGPAHATARVLRRGRSLIVVQVDVRDEGRDVLAVVATLSFSVLPLRPGQSSGRASGGRA